MLKKMMKIDLKISNWRVVQKALVEEERQISEGKKAEEEKKLGQDNF